MGGGLLFVCHANLCRSPMAEYIARELLAEHLPADVGSLPVLSAGTHAVPGHPMHPHAAKLAVERSMDPAPFRSRPVTAEVLAQAGVILTATREQRTACVALAPGTVRRTFTLRQFSRLVTAATEHGWRAVETDGPPTERLRDLVSTAGRARALVQPAPPVADDLPDPLGEPLAEFRLCANQIEQALRPIAAVIARSC
ncbi:low molecular weight phosphatase family protein [Micromonospora sp. NPDC049679]|uniref:arsenate reductase/protein-tyrosine-phosphatase family protein n=1 Tax=Micromonospora sp. NPDC049679 TaxID=3155920 RepID=UPI0033D2F634